MNRTLSIFVLIFSFCYICADADPLHVMTTKGMVSCWRCMHHHLEDVHGYCNSLQVKGKFSAER